LEAYSCKSYKSGTKGQPDISYRPKGPAKGGYEMITIDYMGKGEKFGLMIT